MKITCKDHVTFDLDMKRYLVDDVENFIEVVTSTLSAAKLVLFNVDENIKKFVETKREFSTG